MLRGGVWACDPPGPALAQEMGGKWHKLSSLCQIISPPVCSARRLPVGRGSKKCIKSMYYHNSSQHLATQPGHYNILPPPKTIWAESLRVKSGNVRVSAALQLEKMIAEPAVSFHYCGHGDWRLHGGSMLCYVGARPVATVTALRTSVNYPLAISCWRFFGGTNEKTRGQF